MKVLQVHTTYRESGGEDSVVRGDRSLLLAAGHQVVRHEVANPHGPRTALTLAASPWNPAAARRVREVVRRERPDVAHVHNTWYAMSPSVPGALADAGVPVVATLHNYRRVCASANLFRDGHGCTDCVGSSPWSGVKHACYRGSRASSAAVATTIALNQRFGLLDRSVGRFLVLNRFMLDVFVRSGLDQDKALLKGNWVPDPGPRPAPPSESRSVVVVGRVEVLKGIDVLVDAWEQARPDLELVVVGEGADRARLEARGIPGIRFTGQLPAQEVRSLLLTARATVFPTVLAEGQPMTVLESMAAGTPVLASRTGGTPELLAEAGEQWLVPAGDVAAWASALTALASAPPDELDRTGRLLRARYEREHDEAAGLRGLLHAYAAVGA